MTIYEICVVHSPFNGGSADQQADSIILTRYLATNSVPTLFERIIKSGSPRLHMVSF